MSLANDNEPEEVQRPKRNWDAYADILSAEMILSLKCYELYNEVASILRQNIHLPENDPKKLRIDQVGNFFDSAMKTVRANQYDGLQVILNELKELISRQGETK